MFDASRYDRLLDRALEEDLGLGDVTTRTLVSSDSRGRALVISKEPLTVAGIPLFARVFQRVDRGIEVVDRAPEGCRLLAGETLARLEGPVSSLLIGERVALNFLQRLCGIATLTREFVEAVPKGAKTKILDTRKTTPGLRALERYAVRQGGGTNHRARLDGGLLIKDNHIAACGSVKEALTRARGAQGPSLRIEIEVSNMDQLEEALAGGAEVVMLDNMTPDEVAEAMSVIGTGSQARALVEVSGNVGVSGVYALSSLGVDFISVGALTHSAPAIDLSMKVEPC